MKVLIMTAIYPTVDNPAFGSYVRTQSESLQRAGLDVEMLVLSHRHRKLIYPLAIFQLRERLACSAVDLVHAHYGLVGLIARTQWKVPVVVTYHGSDILGSITKYGKRPLVQRVIASACRVLARHVDAAIVQSDQMAAKIRKAKVHVIPHEVDLDVFRPTDREQARAVLGLDSGKRYLLFAANPRVEVKRFPLAKAAANALARHVDAAIVQSDQMAAKIRKAKVHVIPHEVDLDVFRPTDREQARAVLGLDSGKRYLLFAANPRVEVKRFPLAKAAANALARHDTRV